jgi:hypothetical protein
MNMSANQFRIRGREILQEHYGQALPGLSVRNVERNENPIDLPDGQRMPLNVYLDNVRIRRTMLILFCPTNGSPADVEVEWDDLKQHAERIPKLIEARQAAQNTRVDLERVETYLETRFEKPFRKQCLQVGYREELWDDTSPDGQYRLCWRLTFMTQHNQDNVRLLYQDGNTLRLQHARQPAYRAVSRWRLDYISCRESRFFIRIGEIPDILSTMGLWTIWSCFTSLQRYLDRLTFKVFDFYDVDIRQHSVNDGEPAKTTHPNGIPLIRFYVSPDKNVAWSNDVSIVLHELGHALWLLLFARPPRTIEDDPEQQFVAQGIQEGFCDYLAAAILKQHRNRPVLGGAIRHQLQGAGQTDDELRKMALPRPLTTKAVKINTDISQEERKYRLGETWSHLLWEYRMRVLVGHPDKVTEVDKVILLAHMRPLVNSEEKQGAFRAYFDSLKATSEKEGIQFDGWDALRKKHLKGILR